MAHTATSWNSQGERGEWRAFAAHKATSHANNILDRGRKKEWSALGMRKKKTHLGSGCSLDPWLALLQWGASHKSNEHPQIRRWWWVRRKRWKERKREDTHTFKIKLFDIVWISHTTGSACQQHIMWCWLTCQQLATFHPCSHAQKWNSLFRKHLLSCEIFVSN